MDSSLMEKLYRYLGEERLANSIRTSASHEDAIQQYRRELQLRQILIKPITLVEVILRNSIDIALSAWWENAGFEGTWTDSGAEEKTLSPFLHTSEWRKRASSNKSSRADAITHSDLIAHASFGSWRNMIGNPASRSLRKPEDATSRMMADWHKACNQDARCATLWKTALHAAFPNIPKTKKERGGLSPRAYIGIRLTRISALRNRVCHCDNLAKVNVQARYEDMLQVIDAIDFDLGQWARNECSDEIAAWAAKTNARETQKQTKNIVT